MKPITCPNLTKPLSSNLTNPQFAEFLQYVEFCETNKRANVADMDPDTLTCESRALEKMWIAAQTDKMEVTECQSSNKARLTKMLQTIVCNELNVVFDKHKDEAACVGSAMFAMTSDMEDNADDPDQEYKERRIAGEKRLIARCEEKGVEYHDLDTVETLNIKVAEKRKRSLQGIVWEYAENHGWQKTGVMAAAIHSANPEYSLVSIKSKISTCRNAEKTDKTPAKTIAKKLWKPDMTKSEFSTIMKQYGCAGRTIRELWQNITTKQVQNNK